jgi:signal transduction histidine kinase
MKRRPDLIALTIALTGMLALAIVVVGELFAARERELSTGERRVQYFGAMIGEHTARTFEAVDILLREIAGDLSHSRRDWETWPAAYGWEYLARRHSRTLPQLRDLIVFDRLGNQRYISTYFPAPRINVRDRPYFVALEEGASSAAYGPYVGRNSGRYTYGLARRINDGRGAFAGVVFAAIEPAYFQNFCWPNRLSDDFESVVINARGQIVTSCRPSEPGREVPVLGAPAVDVLFGGALRGWLPEVGVARRNGYITSVSLVPDFPDLRVLTAIPQDSLLAPWQAHRTQIGLLGALVAITILAGSMLVRRQVREMRVLTEDLAANRDQLEARVLEATTEISRQKEQAERANHAKSRFLAAASHDLRQPLHALSLFATDLQRQAKHSGSPELSRVAGKITASTAGLGEMFDSLLDISRLDVAGILPEKRAFALGPRLERLVAVHRRAAMERGQSLRLRPSAAWAVSDPLLVERIVANLIANALRYTQPGGRILVAVRRRGRHVVVEVRDNGPGIAPEHQAAIFNEFYQVGNPAREEGKGLGLGLSIVERLAHALDADVHLRSMPGRGTTFGIALEAAGPDAEPSPAPGAGAPLPVRLIGAAPALDEADELLRDWNYHVMRDKVPGYGLKKMAGASIVLCDSATVAEVRSRCPAETPVIVLADAGHGDLPADVHLMALPLRPARLRALLVQLQKTLLKSTP